MLRLFPNLITLKQFLFSFTWAIVSMCQYVVYMYLPPGSGCDKLLTVVHHLSDILMDDNHLSNSNDIIVVGDFNLPDIDWDTLGSTSYTSEMFCDFVFNNNLLQLVDQSTHTKGNRDTRSCSYQYQPLHPECIHQSSQPLYGV